MHRPAFGRVVLVWLLAVIAERVEGTEPIAIIPQPQAVTVADGRYALPAVVRISAGEDLRAEAEFFAERCRIGLARDVSPSSAPEGEIRLARAGDLPPEGYRLSVSARGIEIVGGDAAGVFYGVQTLLQLWPAAIYADGPRAEMRADLPFVTIADAPALPWRGLHLDSARHFMPKRFILKLLDLMAVHKLNRFHWHLVDSEAWRLEIRKYPKLAQVGQDQPAAYPEEDPTDRSRKAIFRYGTFHGGGYYSQDDVREIVAYAARRHIVIMPEIEFPAHAMAMLTAYPEFSTTGKIPVVKSNHSPDLLNVDDRSLTFLWDILDETMALFPGRWIHFGGDEAPKEQWRRSASVQGKIRQLGLSSEAALQSWLFGEMAAHIAKQGRVAVGWEEITEGFLPAGAVVMPWLSLETAAKVANAGHPVILCSADLLYLDSRQTSDPAEPQALNEEPVTLRMIYDFRCDLQGVAADKRGNIWGAQGQLWTELMPSPADVEYQAFPRVCALAEMLWTVAERKDFSDFETRLAAHVRRLEALKVNYRRLGNGVRAAPAAVSRH